MLSGVLKYSLAVLLTCTFLVGSGARATNNAGSSSAFSSVSASAYAGADTDVSALSGANAFTTTGHFPTAHERHKGIRSYDNTNFPQDNDANRDVKSLGRGTKSGSQNYNKDNDGCSKCKWENDDYWERDEPEEEGNENNGDECDDDDGQYRPDKTHHHGGSRSKEHVSEFHPLGVHKTGPTGIYGDNVKEGVKPDGFGVTNFPGSIGYAGLTSSYASTPRPGSIWNTPFASTSKPGYSGVTVNTFMTTPIYRLGTGWNKGTTSTGYRSTPKSAGDGRHDDTFAGNIGTTPSPTWNIGFSSNPTVTGFPSSQKPGLNWNVGHDNTPAGSYERTPKPETSWNIGIGAPTSSFPASQKSGTSWASGHDNIPIGGYGTTLRPGKGWDTRFPYISTTGSPFLRRPASDWNPNHSNIPAESFGTTPKPGSSWNVRPGAPTTGFSSSQKPMPNRNVGHDNKPAQSFETTPKPESSWNTEFGAPASSSQKPVTSWSTGRDGVSIGSSVSTVNLGRNQNTGFDGKSGSSWSTNQGTMLVSTSSCTRPDTSCNQGNHGPVKIGATPFDSSLVKNDKSPSSISPATSYEGSGTISPSSLKSPSGNQNRFYGQFGATSISGAHAEAGVTSNFGSIPHGRIPIQSQASYEAYGDTFNSGKPLESPAEDSIYGHSGALKPSYGTETSTTTVSLLSTGTRSNIWPASIPSIPAGSSSYSGVKGSFGSTRPIYGNGPLGTQPDNRIVTRPGKQSGGENAPWLSKQPESSITPGGHHSLLPTQQPGGASKTWPSGQVGHDNRPSCSSGSCEGSTGPFSGSSSCEGNYNCNGGCNGRNNNAPTIHGPCSGVINGPSGVNKTYYPAGTGDGNVPSIANTYKSGLSSNIGNGPYLGVNIECGRGDNSCNQGGADVTPENPVQWNSANPFLYGPVGSIFNDASRPLSGTTPKPIGKGNPFLDSSWNTPKASDNNANNDRNVIHPGQENTKPFNKENPFLNNNKRRGDIEINTDEQVIPLGGRKPEGNNLFGTSFGSASSASSGLSYNKQSTSGSGLPSNDYGNIKSSLHPGRVSPQGGHSNIHDSQGTGPLQCKLGLFGCGTSGSGSYAATRSDKHPGGVHGGIDGNIGVSIGGPGSVNSGPGELGSSRTGIAPAFGNYGGELSIDAGHSGSAGNNLAGSVSGAHAGAYAGSFSSAQASSSSFANAKSLFFSGTGGHDNNFGNSGSWSSSGAQNQGEPNSWTSNGASAFASSSARSWSGSHPVDVKG
ncbi:uncharacterized transmembrane protein DDB_G0289901-like isoform X2 [Odontomachus brunneus]|uniref:uncharacterized transmembrane protein DDB_G0289901-like isoform X2 n=1 Tax=Odontomachus brunneus TaxID=486640 RepID=UPI0013F25737|nr:uncharacterized transmembrane protein DDB_G0289901-like isoform X2 [Odontomachus brunneus]